ncbi:TIGR03862 family flavoprotein [Palleronia marisminoris]|uniref:TIGR03862 family flavoprotein n=1 Tax=Palleronia marisminoris TaxID=315423 RepID=UPI000A26B5D3|nr:TIGR03862 family flavoprotein [Palleronia marisminoris]
MDALVVGAGPAGLVAAEELGRAGARVLVAERMPSPARKFLMAGKSGLNLTKDEDPALIAAAYGAGAGPVPRIVGAFGPAEIRAWAEGLGQPLFTGSTGRVFPVAMKASPLLRAWLTRLDGFGVQLRTRWHWTGDGFDTPEGPVRVDARATVLAMGGASWRRLGSDGAWAVHLAATGLPVALFQPANAGLSVAWSNHMSPLFGAPVKNVALLTGDVEARGEFVIARTGLEGGGIYAVSRAVREGAPLALDLKPDLTEAEIRARLARAKGSLGNRLRKLGLDPAQRALLMEFARPLPDDLAPLIKRLPVPHEGLRPLDEAISTAGGLMWDALDVDLMLKDRPGTFACGEMLDWEAPTGGYLLTACLATGRHAGQAAARFLGL